jgi:hypothetical protein
MEAERPEPIESVDNRQFDELHSQEEVTTFEETKANRLLEKLYNDSNAKRNEIYNLLKQIRDEILMDYNGITDNGKVRHINIIFNKYLNEK